jgi:hypothetical protein
MLPLPPLKLGHFYTLKTTKTTNFQSEKENLFLGNKKDDGFVVFVANNDNTNSDLKKM